MSKVQINNLLFEMVVGLHWFPWLSWENLLSLFLSGALHSAFVSHWYYLMAIGSQPLIILARNWEFEIELVSDRVCNWKDPMMDNTICEGGAVGSSKFPLDLHLPIV